MKTEPQSRSTFIDLVRRNREHVDASSLFIDRRRGTPGFATVVGNLEHGAEIAPRDEAARLALIAWLESPECRAVAAKGIL